jgi:hypothetical protein
MAKWLVVARFGCNAPVFDRFKDIFSVHSISSLRGRALTALSANVGVGVDADGLDENNLALRCVFKTRLERAVGDLARVVNVVRDLVSPSGLAGVAASLFG